MVWPETIERAIRVIEDAPFPSRQQKRGMLHDNAERFPGLTPAQIAAVDDVRSRPIADIRTLADKAAAATSRQE